jgi:hypothetical protein
MDCSGREKRIKNITNKMAVVGGQLDWLTLADSNYTTRNKQKNSLTGRE